MGIKDKIQDQAGQRQQQGRERAQESRERAGRRSSQPQHERGRRDIDDIHDEMDERLERDYDR
ncbi:ubiquitin-like protein Pup [Streptomyces thermodiastaticus]|jgi:hypothetical protein|uniref:ubiquitin-like protein Pup n=1 Tax=Streptomyces thermodiastaticus TaxID=44061 RepID=UPI00167B3991|nr:ubiquitin-like protein Pup [Streptomyces thermodiastaticus]MCE7551281.1 ubiquitin-like protein Pup [Streptomyces thermodiastaticus]GHF97442.1 hypothetical protein GCM10018787_52470 [Streptomyces thermodiastaticus]